MATRHRVVIVGGGFGGLHAAKVLCRSRVAVTLIDRRNFHLFQPLLYQVATGGLSPANIASPLRNVLRRCRNVRVLLGEVVDIDPAAREVVLRDGERIGYDSVIVATGARNNYFGHEDWERLAPGLKTIEDATEIRRRILLAFEAAERERDAARRGAWLRFVIVGAGPTGVELAGAIAEIARDTLRHEFRSIDPAEAEIVIVDAAERVLPTYPPELSRKAQAALGRLGVKVRAGVMVTHIDEEGVRWRRPDGTEESVPARTVLWAAGIRASDLGEVLERRFGARRDAMGRVVVGRNLTIAGHEEVMVIGDLACCVGEDGSPLPAIAPVAVQQGRYAARRVLARLRGREIGPFRYRHRGNMATIGRSAAVADIGPLHFNGWLAWVAWLFVHLIQLIGFANRVLVLVQWAWNYFTFNRTARLITGETGIPVGGAGEPASMRAGDPADGAP